MSQEIQLGDKKVIIGEITYLDSIEIADLKEKEGLKSAISKQIQLSTGLSIEEVTALSLKEGIMIQKAVNEVNASDMLDFQETVEEKAS